MKPVKFLLLALALSASSLTQVQAVEVTVNLARSKQYGNVDKLEREKFINFHSVKYMDFNDEEWAYLESLGVNVGRGFMAPGVGSEANKKTPDKVLRQRAANYNKFSINRKGSPERDLVKGVIYTAHPTPGPNPDKPRGNYTFHWKGVDADYSDEVDHAVRYFKYYFKDNGASLPSYYEPTNEPYVHVRDYKKLGVKASEDEIRREIAVLHRELAKGIRKEFGDEMQIGGFGSAWPFFEGFNSDFKHWESRMKMFIDVAGDEMDFLSFHIYDGKNVAGEPAYRSGSNMEALMDIVEGYSYIKYGRLIPLVISEHGSTEPAPECDKGRYSERQVWYTLRSVNHQMIQFMQRPENIEKCVPFISARATWNKGPLPYPAVISYKNAKGEYIWSHMLKLFQLWQGVEGRYLDVESSEIDVLSLAFVDGKDVYVVLNNLDEQTTIDLKLDGLVAGNKIKRATMRRLYQDDGIPQLSERDCIKEISKPIALQRSETAIIKLEYTKKVEQSATINSKRFYASSYLKPIEAGKVLEFDLQIKKGSIERSTLKVAVARPLALKLNAEILVNGVKYPFPTDWKGYSQSNRTKEGFFGTVDIPLDVKSLKENNKISITFPEDGGTLSTVAMSVDYKE